MFQSIISCLLFCLQSCLCDVQKQKVKLILRNFETCILPSHKRNPVNFNNSSSNLKISSNTYHKNFIIGRLRKIGCFIKFCQSNKCSFTLIHVYINVGVVLRCGLSLLPSMVLISTSFCDTSWEFLRDKSTYWYQVVIRCFTVYSFQLCTLYRSTIFFRLDRSVLYHVPKITYVSQTKQTGPER